jgi:hypothetical protein
VYIGGVVGSPSDVRRTFADYLAIDEASELKHEYIGGVVYAMGGGSPEHARLAMAVGGELRAQLVGAGRSRPIPTTRAG